MTFYAVTQFDGGAGDDLASFSCAANDAAIQSHVSS
jgi:hypothetical protein